MRIYPGDIIGVIGNDEQLESLTPVAEASAVTQTAVQNPDDFQLFNVLLTEGHELMGKTPRTSHLRERFDSLVVAVQRDDEFIDQDPDCLFREGDLVWLVGDRRRLK